MLVTLDHPCWFVLPVPLKKLDPICYLNVYPCIFNAYVHIFVVKVKGPYLFYQVTKLKSCVPRKGREGLSLYFVRMYLLVTDRFDVTIPKVS